MTRHAAASAPGGVIIPATRSSGSRQDGRETDASGRSSAPPDLDFDPMLDPDTLFAGLDGPAPAAPASFHDTRRESQTSTGPVTEPVPTSPPTIPLPVAHFFADPPPAVAPKDARGSVSPTADAGPQNGPQPAPPADTVRRPVNPGFGKLNAAPSGSTVHEDLPRTQLRSQAPLGQMPRPDGFDELMQSIMPKTPVAARPAPASPPQRLMGVSDVLSGARTTAGGPASAIPRVSTRETDFFVMKPSNKKAKAIRTEPRTKLNGFLFVLVLLLVLAAVAAAIFYIHR